MGRKKKKKYLRDNISIEKNKCNETVSCVNNFLPSPSDSESTPSSKESATNSGKQFDVMFERYQSSSKRVSGREYYVHSQCQVCKEDPAERVYCPKCHLVVYCSQEHRRQHWPVHADLCRAVGEVCARRGVSHILQGCVHLSPDCFRSFRFNNMMECQREVGRPLDKWEKEIFIFPNVCGFCHEFNAEHIQICKKCVHSGFCKGHQVDSHHEWCSHLISYKMIVKDQCKLGILCPSIPKCKLSSVLPKFLSIELIFKEIRDKLSELEFLELTDIVTYPLTALNVLLQNGNKILSQKHNLTIHIVGAEADSEVINIEKWEYYIQHLLPDLSHLLLVFVGPELETDMNSRFRVCSKCVTAKKSLRIEFHNILYHTFTRKSYFSKPDLICVFNPGLYRTTGFNGKDTWRPTISSMFSSNCPVLITAYTKKEILLDVAVVKVTEQVHVLSEPFKNPFSSLKPSINFVSDEDVPVIFKNNYYSVMCGNVCSST